MSPDPPWFGAGNLCHLLRPVDVGRRWWSVCAPCCPPRLTDAPRGREREREMWHRTTGQTGAVSTRRSGRGALVADKKRPLRLSVLRSAGHSRSNGPLESVSAGQPSSGRTGSSPLLGGQACQGVHPPTPCVQGGWYWARPGGVRPPGGSCVGTACPCSWYALRSVCQAQRRPGRRCGCLHCIHVSSVRPATLTGRGGTRCRSAEHRAHTYTLSLSPRCKAQHARRTARSLYIVCTRSGAGPIYHRPHSRPIRGVTRVQRRAERRAGGQQINMAQGGTGEQAIYESIHGI